MLGDHSHNSRPIRSFCVQSFTLMMLAFLLAQDKNDIPPFELLHCAEKAPRECLEPFVRGIFTTRKWCFFLAPHVLSFFVFQIANAFYVFRPYEAKKKEAGATCWKFGYCLKKKTCWWIAG